MNFAKVFACKFVPMKITGENYKFKTCRCKQNGIRKCVVIKDLFKISAVNYYHKVLHLGCCSSPRSASNFNKFDMDNTNSTPINISMFKVRNRDT